MQPRKNKMYVSIYLESSATIRNSALESDEKMARQLQKEFDKEFEENMKRHRYGGLSSRFRPTASADATELAAPSSTSDRRAAWAHRSGGGGSGSGINTHGLGIPPSFETDLLYSMARPRTSGDDDAPQQQQQRPSTRRSTRTSGTTSAPTTAAATADKDYTMNDFINSFSRSSRTGAASSASSVATVPTFLHDDDYTDAPTSSSSSRRHNSTRSNSNNDPVTNLTSAFSIVTNNQLVIVRYVLYTYSPAMPRDEVDEILPNF